MPGPGIGARGTFPDGRFDGGRSTNWEIELTGKGRPRLDAGADDRSGRCRIVAGDGAANHRRAQRRAGQQCGRHRWRVVSGSAGNVVAQSTTLRLSIRTRTAADRELVLNKVRTLTRTQAEGYGCQYEIREGVPGAVLTNDAAATKTACDIARAAFGDRRVVYPGPTFLGSEDFAFMLQKKPGTYCFIGNGDTPMVHHPEFVFNRDNLTRGAAYWVALTEGYLRRG